MTNWPPTDLEQTDLAHRYLWGPAVDQLLADENVHDLDNAVNNETLRALADQEESVTDVVDSSAKERLHRVFDGFGNVTSETHYNASGTAVTSGTGYLDEASAYTGRLFDKATGLQNNLNRWYDPKIGRWMSEDLIGFAGGDANLYRYVGNSPTEWTDPNGEAHFVRRPLKGWPWLGIFSHNFLDDYCNTELSHEQLVFDDGKQPGNLGYFDDGQVKVDPYPYGYRPEPGQYDDDLMRRAVKNVPPGIYHKWGNNCQGWADKVRKEYDRQKKQIRAK